ncbi:MAG TPA: 2-oxoacid:acceptor oxidoreductase family protein [Candidatus Omnitrophota bacterium]|nr:2-oxoacid:acceptor oxidoreductase family protein [Candidatus Omnitrophota bacterium]
MSAEKINISRFELLMDAGFGAQKAGDILIKAFAHTGRHVFIEPMIPAEISPPPRTRPALSGVSIRVANFDLKNIGNDTDIILAAHEVVLNRRLDDEEHNAKAKVLLDMGDKETNQESYELTCKRCAKLGISVYPFEVSEEGKMLVKGLSGKGKNMYYLGILAAIYQVPEETMVKEIRATFAKLPPDVLDKNIQVFHYGHKYATENIHFSIDITPSPAPTNGEQLLIDGNSAMAMGIIDAGFKLYTGYPITPASSIMHTLAKRFHHYGGMVHQAEDEISAIGTAIGAYFGGVPAVTGTSGPGLSLKQEFIGYATAAEIPIVILDIQRAGPSTGMPTKTEQSDLSAVIWGTHGDHVKVVISVGNVLDCFYAPKLARYFAEKLKLPVFILSDFYMANCYKVINKPPIEGIKKIEEVPDYIFNHFWVNRLPDQIEMVRTEQAAPGTPGHMRRVTGLNTDEKGSINYFSKTDQRAHAVRNEKMHHVSRALREPEMFGTVKEGEILVVGWGSTRGAIAEAVHNCQKEGLSVGGMCFRIVYPLPVILPQILARFKYVVTVESAYGDAMKKPPLATLLRSKTLKDVQCILCRATGRPYAPRFIQGKIKDVLAGHWPPKQ